MAEARGWLPDEVAILPPGPGLASALAAADRNQLCDDDLVRLAQSRLRLISHLQAQLLADLHRIGQRSDEITATDEGARRSWAESEVAFAMTWTGHAASSQLCLAEEAIERLPAVFAALDAGDIDMPKARVCCDTTVGLDKTTARTVVDKVLGEAHKLTTGQLRARLLKLVLAEDPDVKRRNAKETVKDRRVWARLTVDGLAELGGYDLPPHRVAAAMERITALARAAKSDGDLRKLDQLRADVLLDLLVGDGVATGGPITDAVVGLPDDQPPAPTSAAGGPARPGPETAAAHNSSVADRSAEPTPAGTCTQCGHQVRTGAMPAPRRGVIDLQVPLTTLVGLADFPGDLAGYGPVIADFARQIAAEQQDSTWRFSVYDRLGQLIHHGTTRRRPVARDAAFVKARDRTCRAPGCRAPARQCDVDHTDDYASSKDSRRCNLACLCRKHHLLKHLEQTELMQITPGLLHWTTPLGQQYVTRPEPFTFNVPLARLCKT